MALELTGIFIAAGLAAVTAYVAWKETQRWGDLTRLAEYDKRIALIEGDRCTKEDVRLIVKDENESLVAAIKEQNTKLDKMLESLHEVALSIAKRREDFGGD